MASKIFFSALASVLFVQATYSQCIGNLGDYGYENNLSFGNLNPANIINAGAAVLSSNNLGCVSNNLGLISNNIGLAGNNIGLACNNIGLGGNNIGLIGNNIGLIGNSYAAPGTYEVFSVNSASPAYQIPAGVAITSENQLAGEVAVGGALPFLGSAYFGGEVASGGEGVLSYTAGPSVSLNGGGCGYGQGAGIYNNGLTSLGGASVISSGYGGAIVNSLSGGIGGCGCNRGLYL